MSSLGSLSSMESGRARHLKDLKVKKYQIFFVADNITLPTYRRVEHTYLQQRACVSSIFHFYTPFSLHLETSFLPSFPLYYSDDGALEKSPDEMGDTGKTCVMFKSPSFVQVL